MRQLEGLVKVFCMFCRPPPDRRIGAMNGRPHPVALVMIVRNESRCLARCLDSVRAHVDEMLVVDTGSTDDTIAIARDRGARVEQFAWADDFAAARNHALSLVESPWRLIMDGDEWLEAGSQELDSLAHQAPDFIGQSSVVSWIEDESGTLQQAPSWLPRVLPHGVRYAGRIHEQPQSSIGRRRLGLRILHDGYLPGPMAAKRGRNRVLLEQALRETPDDAYLQYQLGKDHEVAGEFGAAAPHYLAADRSVPAEAAWRHDLVLRLLFTLKKLGRFEQALALAVNERPHWKASPDFHFLLGDLLLDATIAAPQRAAESLPLIEQAWLTAIEIGEQPQLSDSVAGRGSHLAAHNLGAFHQALGNHAAAAQWRERAEAWRAAALPGL